MLAVPLPRRAAFPATSRCWGELRPLLYKGRSSELLAHLTRVMGIPVGTMQSSSWGISPGGLLCSPSVCLIPRNQRLWGSKQL